MIVLRLTLTRTTVIDDDAHPHRGEARTTLHAARLGHMPPLAIEHLRAAALPHRRWSKLAGLLRGIAKRIDGEVPARKTD